MGGKQNTQLTKRKQVCENKKHAHRSQQQHTVPAHEFKNTELIDGMDVMLKECKYNDLTDGRYEKTTYVRTWTGRTVSLETDLDHAVGTVKRQLGEVRNTEGSPASREQRKSPDGQQNAEGFLRI